MDEKAVNSQEGQVETRYLEKSLEGAPGREFNHGRERNLKFSCRGLTWRYSGNGDMCHSSSERQAQNAKMSYHGARSNGSLVRHILVLELKHEERISGINTQSYDTEYHNLEEVIMHYLSLYQLLGEKI
jgi:hypothetical protein